MNPRSLLFALIAAPLLHGQQVPLRIESQGPKSSRIQVDQDRTVTISEGGPISLRLTPSETANPNANVLEFESFSLGGCKEVSAILSDDAKKRPLPDIDHSEAWTTYKAQLTEGTETLPPWKHLVLNLPLGPEATLSIRNARLRPANPNEFAKPSIARTPVFIRNELIKSYLQAESDFRIDHVALTDSEVQVTFTLAEDANQHFLGELPIHRSIDDPKRFEFLAPLGGNAGIPITLSFPRIRDRLGHKYDRLTSRWQIVKVVDGERLAVSHARYPDEFPSAHPELEAAEPANKKGLGGWSASRQPKGDLKKLGISAITVNVIVDSLLSPLPGKHTTPFTWQGRRYHANTSALARYDASFMEAAERKVVVSAVLLVSNPNRGGRRKPSGRPPGIAEQIAHPQADPAGVYAMPAMDSEAGVGAYGAALHLFASRYSRPDGKFGRVHHYIVHNEVDAGWTWTNCGVKPLPYFFDLYHRSMRLVDLVARSQDPNARAFISLTHHWAEPGNPKFYGSKYMMLELAKWNDKEGDFPWALAHHPYPASLRNPRTWEDKVRFDFDSDRITPRNIEVLDAWMKRPDMLDRYGKTRPVHLSENGFNSPDYSGKSLTDQAAGMAYAWKKIAPLDTIRVWHYHNWIDNRKEGNLRIGLRRFPDDETDPLGEKPIYKLYCDLGTSNEEAACRRYLPVVGKKDWSEILYRDPIDQTSGAEEPLPHEAPGD